MKKLTREQEQGARELMIGYSVLRMLEVMRAGGLSTTGSADVIVERVEMAQNPTLFQNLTLVDVKRIVAGLNPRIDGLCSFCVAESHREDCYWTYCGGRERSP